MLPRVSYLISLVGRAVSEPSNSGEVVIRDGPVNFIFIIAIIKCGAAVWLCLRWAWLGLHTRACIFYEADETAVECNETELLKL